jgi:hypothetical protein
MRKLLPVVLLSLFLIPANESPTSGQTHPVPPGIKEGDKVMNAQSPNDLPTPSRKLPPPAQLRSEADELAKLSAEIPPQIELVTQGQLPKGLADQLKRIEKLSKHLRTEIYP